MPSIAAGVAAGVTALGLAVGGFFYASRWPTSQIFGKTLIAGENPYEVALTFDDGPNDAATPQLLEVLSRHNARATFFMMGDYARLHPKVVRDVVAAGHLLGNHTMSHPTLSMESAVRVRQELADCSAVLEDIAGIAVRFFRPPFGARRPVVLQTARELGLTPVMWNVTGYDWNPIGADGILTNIESGIKRNQDAGRASNVLLHDGSHRGMGASRMDTVHAVERILHGLGQSDNKLVTVDHWALKAR